MWDVRTGLIDTFTPVAVAASAKLFDGPRRRGDTPKLFLVVGADSDDPFDAPVDVDDTLTGLVRQGWSAEGPGTWRDEAGSVLCTVVAWSGDDEFAPLRARVRSFVDDLEAALIADRQLGDTVGAGVELAEMRVWERRRADGIAVGAVLDIAYQSLLT